MWERPAGEFDDFGHALFLHTKYPEFKRRVYSSAIPVDK